MKEAPRFNEVNPELMFNYEARQAGEKPALDVTPGEYIELRYGNLPEDADKSEVDAYFEQQRADHFYNTDSENGNRSYEDLSVKELADELAYAELMEDNTKAGNISDVLLDRLIELTEKTMDNEQQMRMLDSVLRLKDQKKVEYLETNGHEIGDAVRKEVLAAQSGEDKSSAPVKAELEQPDDKHDNTEDSSDKSELEQEKLRYEDLYKQLEEAEPGSEQQKRLVQEVRELGSSLHSREVAAAADAAFKAQQEGNDEEAEEQAAQARAQLDKFIALNGIESDEAQALRDRLEEAVESGDTSGIFDADAGDEGAGNAAPADELDNEGSDDVENDEVETQKRKSLKDRWKALRSGNVREAFARNPRPENEEGEKRSKVRRYAGAAVLVAAGFLGGYLLGNAGDSDRARENYPDYIQDEIDQDKLLQEAGVEDAKTREAIVHNPDDFKRMAENPERFQEMMDWREARIQELMAQDENLKRSGAEQLADWQLSEFFEDLDDEDRPTV